MPEPFKNLFNPALIARMGDYLLAAHAEFGRDAFVAAASDGLDRLELKERSAQIQAALDKSLPLDFRSACNVMLASLSPKTDEDWRAEDIETLGISGWAVMPMAEVVAARGLDDFDFAMDVLAELTKRFTSEFAVRPFLIADPERGLQIARKWAEDGNYHVRRLASEGTRPRLPWGLLLQSFVQDPKPLLPLLTHLRDDPSEYVRRSVANSLNDIAKDHPDLIAGIAADWLRDAPKDRVRLVKHACRTLIKSGHAPTLAALGYGRAEVAVSPLTLGAPVVNMGGYLEFSATVTSQAKTAQPLIIDYVIHHRKANGATSPKTFKWKVVELGVGKSASLSKRHSIKPITTRVYYAGQHAIEIQINGQSYGEAKFELIV